MRKIATLLIMVTALVGCQGNGAPAPDEDEGFTMPPEVTEFLLQDDSRLLFKASFLATMAMATGEEDQKKARARKALDRYFFMKQFDGTYQDLVFIVTSNAADLASDGPLTQVILDELADAYLLAEIILDEDELAQAVHPAIRERVRLHAKIDALP